MVLNQLITLLNIMNHCSIRPSLGRHAIGIHFIPFVLSAFEYFKPPLHSELFLQEYQFTNCLFFSRTISNFKMECI